MGGSHHSSYIGDLLAENHAPVDYTTTASCHISITLAFLPPLLLLPSLLPPPHSDAPPLLPSPSYPRTESQENILESPATYKSKKVERKEEEEEVRKRLVRKASVIG